ncbi:adenylyltransferase/cytidyltransferase family protein [Planctomycetales bacterium ZRK34]|nr:adenylyltransferase/cytidyltransferase family protein [Planctomycetales bacterium ZRK34]
MPTRQTADSDGVKLDVLRKLVPVGQLQTVAQRHASTGRSIVLAHGCFDIVHPGHVRYLQFARRQGDVLIVSLTGDDAIEKSDGMRPYVPQELRAESLAALEFVDHVVIADDPTAEPIIRALRPNVYVKGKEYEHSADPRFLAEKDLVESLGGRIIYSSGDVVYSSTALIDSALATDPSLEAGRLGACCARWGVNAINLRRTISGSFVGKKIAVVGDALLDRYVFCDAMDVAGEAPILSVRPLDEATYLGGAAIIAAHLKSLGASPHLLTTVGDDVETEQLIHRLDEHHITHTALRTRTRLPSKLRFLVDTQKLLKVDKATAQPLDTEQQRQLVGALCDQAEQFDAVIFTDFGYGTVTNALLEAALPKLRPHVGVITGDVSGARRSLLAMHGADLLTPTERELRSAAGDYDQSLPAVAMGVMKQLRVPNLAVTMGRRGCILFHPRETEPERYFTSRLRSEYLPALARHAVDPVGAGDAFLSAATLMLTTGATLMQAGYVGSAAAAVTIERVGNLPVSRDQLLGYLSTRRELSHASATDAG